MRGEPGALYDGHAERLYAYCWSLVGQDAPAAVRDAFTAAVQHPPRGDAALWLYALARTACARRGGDRAFAMRIPDRADPLLRAAAGLRADQREALMLAAGEWLEPHDIAQVLGIAPDTTRQMLHLASSRLERAVLDDLLHRVPDPRYADVITAFEKGRLPQLLARRAPARPPAALRAEVLAAYEAEATSPLPTVASPAPLVVINPTRAAAAPGGRSGRTRRGKQGKVAGGVAGLAAASAAAVGLLAAWTGQHGDDGDRGKVQALVPSTVQSGPDPAKTHTATGAGGQAPAPTTSATGPYDPNPPRTPDATRSPAPTTSAPATTAPATKSDPAERDTGPSKRARTKDPGKSPDHRQTSPGPPSRTQTEPTATAEPEPAEPAPTGTADPSPTPTSNPTPSPTTS